MVPLSFNIKVLGASIKEFFFFLEKIHSFVTAEVKRVASEP